MVSFPSMITFGPVARWPAPDRITAARARLRQDPRLPPICKAISSLPNLWERLSPRARSFKSFPGGDLAKELTGLLLGDIDIPSEERRESMLNMPLTVLLQFLQYLEYLDGLGDSDGHTKVLRSAQLGGGIQGFCAGLLNALGVASAGSVTELINYGAISIKLAFCIGAFVDSDQACRGEELASINLAVRWKSSNSMVDLKRILSAHTETYVAVSRDIRDTTITIPSASATAMTAKLAEYTIVSRNAGFNGRYHNIAYTGAPEMIIDVCDLRTSLYGHQKMVRSNADSAIINGEKEPIKTALESIMVHHADWYNTITTATSSMLAISAGLPILTIGADAFPTSMIKHFSLVSLGAEKSNSTSDLQGRQIGSDSDTAREVFTERAIAVIGMSCKFPGAESVDDFWELLIHGRSMLSRIPEDRFDPKDFNRSSRDIDFWGNYVSDIQAFDHKFFKKSAREAASMDPQQRWLLQLTYHALESSGYFSRQRICDDIGCYLGLCSTDYDANVGCHPPTAYSTTGTLRAFLSGKLSHCFGWSGPSLTFDTACSSSAVAIHTACSAILAGECSQAIAGGVALFTSPYLFENLATAHFLSPTGATKPFDAAADGYCRGEGIGLVVLKRLSDAVRDGDNVLGVIAGSAINQNNNCVPITVPHSVSQGSLYQKVAKQAGIDPIDLTFVEAHGTGTPVGDPIEMESIRSVFGGAARKNPLFVTSVKGNIGHLEGASGVAALIKALLQMHYRTVCVQASFKTLNPRIPALQPDNLSIPTANVQLPEGRLSACVNNYGAAGSNAALLILQAPRTPTVQTDATRSLSGGVSYPVQLAAASSASLVAHARKLLEFTRGHDMADSELPSFAYSLSRQTNQSLPFMSSFTTSTLQELKSGLSKIVHQIDTVKPREPRLPVVLAFGGQVGQHVGLSKVIFEEFHLLRQYLDQCDAGLKLLGHPSIYPAIFQAEPIVDVVVLQSCIFSLQYSTALAWINSGLIVDAVIGHSLGQLAALSVSGVLSLHDGLKYVAGRAALMKTHWGAEPGTMIAVEAEPTTLNTVQELLITKNRKFKFEIASYNSPTSHVFVSDKASIAALQEELQRQRIKHKRLNVTHGFHSRFTDDLVPHLERLATSLKFHEASIHIETCTKDASWTAPSPGALAAHTRDPVFFGQAIERLESKLGPCTFLEVGTNSSITAMARRATQQHTSTSNFIPLNLVSTAAATSVANVTMSLWDVGHQVQFWGFHSLQRGYYSVLHLPGYQFEKTTHWLKLEPPATSTRSQTPVGQAAARSAEPLQLLRRLNLGPDKHTFLIEPRSNEFQEIAGSFRSIGSAKCWNTLVLAVLSRALDSVATASDPVMAYLNLKLDAPISVLDETHLTLLLSETVDGWAFQVKSNPTDARLLAAGKISRSITATDIARYERIVDVAQIERIASDEEALSIRGRLIDKLLHLPVESPHHLRSLKRIDCLGSSIAARIRPAQRLSDALPGNDFRPFLLDGFLQVVEFYSNCIHEHSESVKYSLRGIEQVVIRQTSVSQPNYDHHVLAFVTGADGDLTFDMFVFSGSKHLEAVLLGIRYGAEDSLMKATDNDVPTQRSSEHMVEPNDVGSVNPKTESFSQPMSIATKHAGDPKRAIFIDVCTIVEGIADVPKDEIEGESSFEDIGVDSLMMIEVIDEVSRFFKKEIPIGDLEQLTDFNSLVHYLHGIGARGTSTDSGEDDSDSMNSEETAVSTPPTSQGSVTPASTDQRQTTTNEVCAKSSSLGTQPVNLAPANDADLEASRQIFNDVRLTLEMYNRETGFDRFWNLVYPDQARLVQAYIVEAFAKLGVDLDRLSPGGELPELQALPKYDHLARRMKKILVDGGILETANKITYWRSAAKIDLTPSDVLHEQMLEKYPRHSAETELVHVTGSCMAECMTGKIEPLSLLFASKANRGIMADVYENAPMCQATTRLLSEFLAKALAHPTASRRPYRILEVGAGTGGTARYLISHLTSNNVNFEYTFTDLSSGLVAQAKRSFRDQANMQFMALDCDKPPQELLGTFDVVVATNVIHATNSADRSVASVQSLLRPNGIFCLVEFTRSIYWFDLVYGLLEGWWLFDDGRKHALANEAFWDRCLRCNGFNHVSWSGGDTEEANTMRLITGFKGGPVTESVIPKDKPLNVFKRAGIWAETFTWKEVGKLKLQADVYYPKKPDEPGKKRVVALMIHGGGHLLFSRKDIPMKHVRTLLKQGYLPVSVDYRLCPEMTLYDGPVTDCCDALKWAREVLPTTKLSGPAVSVDPDLLLALGWSSGGQLAMTLGYTPQQRGLKPPDVILPFYSPSDLEAGFWWEPIYPAAAEESPTEIWGELDCVRDEPIVEYAPLNTRKSPGLSLTLADDRARLILHMNWKGQSVNVLIRGLPSRSSLPPDDKTDWKNLPRPSDEEIRKCSPYWHIVHGEYETLTFMVHGDKDDWIPYQMTEKTIEALREKGVACGIVVPEGCGHAFDLFPAEDPLGVGWGAVEKGYEFAEEQFRLLREERGRE